MTVMVGRRFVSDVDLILQDFRLFVGIALQDAFQSPVGVTTKKANY